MFPEHRILLTNVAQETKGRFVPQLFLGTDTGRPWHSPTASTWHCQQRLTHQRHMGRGEPPPGTLRQL